MSSQIEDQGARKALAITKSDSADQGLGGGCRALFIGGAGDVAVIAVGDTSAVTFAGLAAGSILPVQAKRVMSTNTTATSIVALF